MTATAPLLAVCPMLEAALGYTVGGWPVFPVVPRGKKPLTEHGFKDA